MRLLAGDSNFSGEVMGKRLLGEYNTSVVLANQDIFRATVIAHTKEAAILATGYNMMKEGISITGKERIIVYPPPPSG